MDYTLEGEELFKKINFHIKLLFIPHRENNFRPNFLRSNVLLYIVIFLLILRIISVVVFINFPKNIFFADITKTVLVSLINQERSSLGFDPLIENQKLNEAALLKAKDILEKDYFSHQSPSGITPWYWFLKTGYIYKYAGENLAIGFLNSEDVYEAWANSVSHKENMINPNYKEIGTAVLTGDYKGNNATVVVQLFGSPEATNDKPIVLTAPTAAETIEINEEKSLPAGRQAKIEEKEVVAKNVLSQSATKAPLEGEDGYYKLLNFIFYNSNKIFEYSAYFLLILTGLAILFNILIKFNIQDRNLILKSLIIIILLSATILLNREIINQFIPDKIII
ncbi:MAG: hypothetical protein HY005_02495 [Candidatus Staskawiczbacteria bacterium]|nr:hypothetical protein [Candidatus Staskawiczbacteria bacterium]